MQTQNVSANSTGKPNEIQRHTFGPSLPRRGRSGHSVDERHRRKGASARARGEKGWETTAAAGLTITRGTRDTLLVTAGLNTSRQWDKDEAALGISGGYGEDNSVVNNEFIQGFGQYNRLFTEKFYGGFRLDAAFEGIANLDYRVTLTPLAGYYLIKNAKPTLAVEVGRSAVLEKFSGEASDTCFGIRFAEHFEQKLTGPTKIWENASYDPPGGSLNRELRLHGGSRH